MRMERQAEFLDKAADIVQSEVPPVSLVGRQDDVEVQSGDRDTLGDSGLLTKKLASVIVSPPLRRASMKDNVTIRSRSVTRSLSFANDEDVDEEEQVIGALADMQTDETHDVTRLDQEVYDDAEDDLLGEEFMELSAEESKGAEAGAKMKTGSKRQSGRSATSSSSLVTKPGFLRRGSPRLRVAKTSTHTASRQKAEHLRHEILGSRVTITKEVPLPRAKE
ncbi:unnamed protein product [Eruca vesicaria subsp. sativa]|uniref:Uncharacterized protein n=1 Tax=Eruca vesicaria subsp. sativa TaxID=29727 RepID=A0ABC8L850_ERUVS|nr:unnamed protein product [Eruca vesicaria subsp. sativa]